MNFNLGLLHSDNPVFQGYLTYACVLVVKMMLMSVLTAFQRIRHKVPASKEDAVVFAKATTDIVVQHDAVERVCSAHRNDMENIPIFLIAALAFVLTDPNVNVALYLFRAYTICRFVHTFVYAIVVIPQPARGLAWLGGYLITGYIAFAVIVYFHKF